MQGQELIIKTTLCPYFNARFKSATLLTMKPGTDGYVSVDVFDKINKNA